MQRQLCLTILLNEFSFPFLPLFLHPLNSALGLGIKWTGPPVVLGSPALCFFKETWTLTRKECTSQSIPFILNQRGVWVTHFTSPIILISTSKSHSLLLRIFIWLVFGKKSMSKVCTFQTKQQEDEYQYPMSIQKENNSFLFLTWFDVFVCLQLNKQFPGYFSGYFSPVVWEHPHTVDKERPRKETVIAWRAFQADN